MRPVQVKERGSHNPKVVDGLDHYSRKVLVLNHFVNVSPRVMHETQVLQSQGYEVHVLSWARDRDMVPSETLPGIPQETFYHPMPQGTLARLVSLPWLYLMVSRRLKRKHFDVIHCTHIMFLLLAVVWGRWRKAKIIYDAYEFYLQETADRLPRLMRWLVPLLRKLEGVLVKQVDGVLTIDSHDNQLEKYYRKHNSNVSSIYNVPDITYSLDQEKLDCLYQLYRCRKIVLYIGGISLAKGALQAIEGLNLVVAKEPDVLFLLVGMFHGETGPAFWKRVKAHRLEKNVQFVPWVPYIEMLHYVEVSHVGLALHQPTSRYELLGQGNGRKVFTYMQSGVPVVAPDFGEVGRIVREEKCGLLVDTTDSWAIADTIIHLLEHPDEAKAMGERGKKAIKEKYNWSAEQTKFLAVYRKLEESTNDQPVRT